MSEFKPTPVRVGVMDSQKPGVVTELGVEVLSSSARAMRGFTRGGLVSALGLLLIPIPLIHFCVPVVVLIVGPIVGVFAWKKSALIAAGQTVQCAKCNEPITIAKNLAGWPARVHCGKCGAMVELNPAELNPA
jgi:hypothetical protein